MSDHRTVSGTIHITAYRDGRVRLTKAAAIYFNTGPKAEFRPGSATEPWWLDLRSDAPPPVSESRATWQFRSGYRLERVFPHNSPKQKIMLAPAQWPQLLQSLLEQSTH
ncbi:hypothetical protein DNI29_22460 [Hymenobacter sediminis]|uniref:hypothetical protein n=1 Tax=Hymenobacter sediminis TaxID=2218621 RepID=UPI000DA67FCB|nr:hypothetical protein [Hymenobacter sediminis]RPD44162.1 hypothetical protein DNI29_22460 [Hymenobacter sediminis]